MLFCDNHFHQLPLVTRFENDQLQRTIMKMDLFAFTWQHTECDWQSNVVYVIMYLPLCVCVCVCLCMCICMCVCVFICVYICICICLYVYVCVCVCDCVHKACVLCSCIMFSSCLWNSKVDKWSQDPKFNYSPLISNNKYVLTRTFSYWYFVTFIM